MSQADDFAREFYRLQMAVDNLILGETPTGGGGGGTPANPSATAGKVAVNGVAATYMRSDAAPAIGDSDKTDGFHASATPGASTIPVSDGSGKLDSWITAPPAGANPTATAGSAVVNGVAATFMRSDGAPALPVASTSTVGIVQLATSGNTGATLAVTGSDARLSDSRAPNGSASGDLTGSYPGPTVAAAAISLAKMANLAANSIIGNNTGAGATPIALTAAQAKTLLAIGVADVTGFDTQVRTSRLDQMAAATAGITVTDISQGGNHTFSGTGRRIIADFSNATHALRLLFQTSTAATGTRVGFIPSAGGTQSSVLLYGLPDPDNSEYLSLGIGASYTVFNSSKTGTGVTKPFALQIDGTTRFVVTLNGAILIGRTSASGADAAGNAEVNGTFRANVLQSEVATGTAPLIVASTTKVTNFNADQVDGVHIQANATPATTGTMTVTMDSTVKTITPSGACTFNASGGVAGQGCTFVITTSGVSSFVLTWGTAFKTTGTLATGTVTAKTFTVTFAYDGTNWCECSRSTAM